MAMMSTQAQSYKVVLCLGALMALFACVSSQGGHQSTVSHCTYLTRAMSKYENNAAPFKIYTRSRSPRITSGQAVEVTIAPASQLMNFFNFTDFIMYATPVIRANMELEFWPGANSNSKPHLGVFQVFEKWSSGAGALSCNPRSRVEDSVGAFEERLLNIYRRFAPNNPMLASYRPPARNFVSALWWPTKEALAYPEIQFEAKIKSGEWFTLKSTPWHVNRPVDHWANTERMLNRYHHLQSSMQAMERRLDKPGV